MRHKKSVLILTMIILLLGGGLSSLAFALAPIDRGDAPDPPYPTFDAITGAHHEIINNVYLGACVDHEDNGQPTGSADGDDKGASIYTKGTCAVAGDDEDGVAFDTPLVPGVQASITVTANDAYVLTAWIDFNQDGDWLDADESLFPSGQILTAGANPLTFIVPAGATLGTTYARFRASSFGVLPPDGFIGDANGIPDGEVEDYKVTIGEPAQTLAVRKDGDGAGTVTSTPPGIDCGLVCAWQFTEGAGVKLIGTPDDGSALDGWQVVAVSESGEPPDTNGVCPGNGPCNMTVDRNYNVTATFNPDLDGDGISDIMENGGPNGGDGNSNGILDFQESNVATLMNIEGNYVTLVSEEGTALSNVTAQPNPSPGDAPEGFDFSAGFYGFTVQGDFQDGRTTVTLIFQNDETFNHYFKHGPTPDDARAHWYDFIFDGLIGAVFTRQDGKNMIILNFQDGAKGDDDLTVNDSITDIGGPTNAAVADDDNGGGCSPVFASPANQEGKPSGFDLMIPGIVLACLGFYALTRRKKANRH